MADVPCDKCNGSGLIARENVENDKELHPVLSQHQTICFMCGGGGVKPVKTARQQAVEAAQRAAS